MIFSKTMLVGVYIIDMEQIEDERGFFARSWCEKEFSLHEINSKFVQCNISFNKKMGTLRGMHYQAAPFEEAKLIRCIKGSVYDVVIDIQPNSPSFMKWFGVRLSADSYKLIYIPKGFAHGFITLEDNTELFYQMSEFYHPESANGIMWDDPKININWPEINKIISKKDLSYKYLV